MHPEIPRFWAYNPICLTREAIPELANVAGGAPQHDNQSWLAALAAIMDSCALVLVGVEAMSPLQARMTFTMARQVLVEMAHSFGVAPSRYSGGDRLPHAIYLRMEAAFATVALAWRGGPETEEILAALRATYEPLLDGLASHLLLPLPGWIADRDATDHWAGGPRGLIAGHLIGQLSQSRPSGEADTWVTETEEVLWRRLRARLRRSPLARSRRRPPDQQGD
jgi:hypothetical protein